jgi:hypothetical protein
LSTQFADLQSLGSSQNPPLGTRGVGVGVTQELSRQTLFASSSVVQPAQKAKQSLTSPCTQPAGGFAQPVQVQQNV